MVMKYINVLIKEGLCEIIFVAPILPRLVPSFHHHFFVHLKGHCHDIFAKNCYKCTEWSLHLCSENQYLEEHLQCSIIFVQLQ